MDKHHPQTGTFLTVMEQHKGIIYKIAHAYCRDPEDRKDLVQEIIYQLCRSFGSYDDRYKYSTWIYRIALNVAISFYRKNRRRADRAGPLLTDEIVFQETEEDAQRLQQLRLFIDGLKKLDRAIMILYLEEKSHKEMADILGLTTTNIATRLGRIREKLRQQFSALK